MIPFEMAILRTRQLLTGPSSCHHINKTQCQTRPNKTDAGNGSKAICRVSNVLRSPSPDPKRSGETIASHRRSNYPRANTHALQLRATVRWSHWGQRMGH
jgi:hypothetical protein